MREVRVSHVMTPQFNRLAPTAGIGEIKQILSVDPDADIVVVDEDGRQLGMVGSPISRVSPSKPISIHCFMPRTCSTGAPSSCAPATR